MYMYEIVCMCARECLWQRTSVAALVLVPLAVLPLLLVLSFPPVSLDSTEDDETSSFTGSVMRCFPCVARSLFMINTIRAMLLLDEQMNENRPEGAVCRQFHFTDR